MNSKEYIRLRKEYEVAKEIRKVARWVREDISLYNARFPLSDSMLRPIPLERLLQQMPNRYASRFAKACQYLDIRSTSEVIGVGVERLRNVRGLGYKTISSVESAMQQFVRK